MIPAIIYLFKVNNRNTNEGCEICSKLIKHQDDVNDVVLVFLLLTLNISKFTTFPSVSIVDFEQVNVSWDLKANNSSNSLMIVVIY